MEQAVLLVREGVTDAVADALQSDQRENGEILRIDSYRVKPVLSNNV